MVEVVVLLSRRRQKSEEEEEGRLRWWGDVCRENTAEKLWLIPFPLERERGAQECVRSQYYSFAFLFLHFFSLVLLFRLAFCVLSIFSLFPLAKKRRRESPFFGPF